MIAPLPDNEAERLDNLRRYAILDTLPEEEYDDIAFLASQICGTPISLISFVDQGRQWFKSGVGLDDSETPRELAICAHNILQPEEPLVVRDLREDERFADNLLVTEDPNIVFYAGVPLVSREGHALGSLCVIDHQPREMTAEQLSALGRLSRQVLKLLELRFTLRRAEEHRLLRAKAYADLKEFSHVIAHDLKTPLRNLHQLTGVLVEELADCTVPDEVNELLGMATHSSSEAIRLVDSVLRYSQATTLLSLEKERIDLPALIEQLTAGVGLPAHLTVRYRGRPKYIHTSRVALVQILSNLLSNAIKYHDKSSGEITVDCRSTGGQYDFRVSDNGRGIPADRLDNIFRLFYGSGEAGSHGVGLTIVSRLVTELGGDVRVTSTEGEGSVFAFTLTR